MAATPTKGVPDPAATLSRITLLEQKNWVRAQTSMLANTCGSGMSEHQTTHKSTPSHPVIPNQVIRTWSRSGEDRPPSMVR